MRVTTTLPKALALGLLLLVHVGCLKTDTVVKLRPDGSGTVEQTMLVNTEAFDGFAAMAGGDKGDGKVSSNIPTPSDMLDEAKLKDAAARLGPGVKFVSATPLEDGKLKGARAVFAFDDINKVNVTSGGPSKESSNDAPMTFRMERRAGGTSVLTVRMPDRPDEISQGQAGEKTPPMPPQMLALFKPLFADMRIGVALDLEGAIVKTNAAHVAGSRITLLDVDFGTLIGNDGAFEKLMAMGPNAKMSDVAPVLKDIPGLKVQTSETVSVEFK
ncbi:MAG: hypothetical protein AB7I50_09085 [Vicinamibacterales bacterium]